MRKRDEARLRGARALLCCVAGCMGFASCDSGYCAACWEELSALRDWEMQRRSPGYQMSRRWLCGMWTFLWLSAILQVVLWLVIAL